MPTPNTARADTVSQKKDCCFRSQSSGTFGLSPPPPPPPMAATSSSLLTIAKPFLQSRSSRPSPAAISAHFCAPPSSPRSLSASRRSAARRVSAVAQKWEPSKVVPQADRVLIRLEELPEKSSGGVLLPKSAVKFERYLMGEVLSVGPGVGELEAGKRVLFSDINAYEVDLGTETRHCFCRAGDLLALVE